jgi:hypothetical protein
LEEVVLGDPVGSTDGSVVGETGDEVGADDGFADFVIVGASDGSGDTAFDGDDDDNGSVSVGGTEMVNVGCKDRTGVG